LIALSHYDQYTKTWEGISTAHGDFEAGFRAGEKKYLMLKAHEEAVEINLLIVKWNKEAKKPCSIRRSQYKDDFCYHCDNYDRLHPCPPKSKADIMNKIDKKLAEFGVDQRGHNLPKRR
jgi:hypothetical protein